jgi:Ceroid-lipofuscinosis neuronal protein 6
MSRTSPWPLVCLAVAFAVLVNGPALFPAPFGPYPLLRWGDVLDLFSPLVLLPLYWTVLCMYSAGTTCTRSTIAFIGMAGLWAEAQGMHLAANSIGHYLGSGPDAPSTELAYMYDEVLSHYLWHFAIIALSLLLLVRERTAYGQKKCSNPYLVAAAGALYGLSFFIIVDEGQTVPLGLPFAVIIVVWALFRARHGLSQHPVSLFLLVTYAVASVLLIGWGVYWRGFPEFSSLGWIQ